MLIFSVIKKKMKVIKLGSKPDTNFQTQANNVRYVATELETDVVVNVGDIKFYLHKFPLLSKSAKLRTLILSTSNGDEIDLFDTPGGPIAFEICVKFCYGIIVTLNAYNVIAARCAAEYLEMHEEVEKGNLIYKINVFLNSSILRSWKDSIIVLSMTTLLPLSNELNLTSRCVESIAFKCSVDVAEVNWSYTYNRENIYKVKGNSSLLVPNDWWVEDLSRLEVDLFKLVVCSIKARGRVLDEIIGKALKVYAFRNLTGFVKGMNKFSDTMRAQSIIDVIVSLLPVDKGCVSCDFFLKLLKAAISVGSGELTKKGLVMRIGQQLAEASMSELMMYDVDTVRKMVEEFAIQNNHKKIDGSARLKVAILVDEYLAAIAKGPNLTLSEFADFVEITLGFPRPCHDGLYRAIDVYLKEHPEITKSERKRICRLINCKKLSANACIHAVQNERLPLRLICQVLFAEQIKTTTSSSCNTTPFLPKGCKDSTSNSHGSSRSATTNTDEDLDGLITTNERKALRAHVAALRFRVDARSSNVSKGTISKMKGLLASNKVFSTLWSSKDDSTGSDSHPEGAKSTNSRNRRLSVSQLEVKYVKC